MGKTLLLISLCIFAGITSANLHLDLNPLWQTWKQRHGKSYTSPEERARFAIFQDNYHKIMKFNAENTGVKLAINKFADLTAYEFQTLYADGDLPHNENDFEFIKSPIKTHYTNENDLPASVDWRSKGAVTPVKDQGNCGSSWSFTTTGVLEGFNFVKNDELVSFSEQQFIDCDTTANLGCNGGIAYIALTYAASNGVELETDYPYTAEDGTCKYDKTKARIVNSNFARVTPKDPIALKTALVDQPVAVSLQAEQSVFQFYSSGVISANCGDSIDHAVLAVGYGMIGELEAFTFKNSWGADWGDQGYVHISTLGTINNGYGACGILNRPVIPV